MSSTGPHNAQPSILEVRPYKTVQEVKRFLQSAARSHSPEWMPLVPDMSEGSEYCTAQSDLLKNPRPLLKRNSVPKTLVCHDFKGGYLDDRFVRANLDGEKSDLYPFKNWSMIDTFVYFSHYLVTVPPPVYIAAAHAHGVAILGTLITEGKSGADAVDEFLLDDGFAFAENLAQLSRLHKFDGYLINIESNMVRQQVPKMINFLRFLRAKLPANSQLIWYDSVIYNGAVVWQNELNRKNYDFFNVCDGIFLNYVYKREQLEMSSIRAGQRKHDVYVGVDVFGRGCPGAGFSSSDAVNMAREFDMSVAIFAPAWTYENLPGDSAVNDAVFWSALSKNLYAHGVRDKGETQFVISGDGRYASAEMSKNLYPLTMPSLQPADERKVLIEFQRDASNWRLYYSRLPKRIVEIKKSASSYNYISIDNSHKFESLSVPLMFFETVLKNGLSLDVSSVAQAEKITFYVIVENPLSRRKDFYTLEMSSPQSSETLPGLAGTLLEIGVQLPPTTTLLLQKVVVAVI